MRFFSSLIATTFSLQFVPSTHGIIIKPSKPLPIIIRPPPHLPPPPPAPAPLIPFINSSSISTTPRYVYFDNLISSSSKAETSFFGSDISSSDSLTAISSQSSVSIFSTKNQEWKEIETIEYSPEEIITSICVCDDVVAVAIIENLCDDNLLNCQIMNPQLNFMTVTNEKISNIQSYGGSFLYTLLSPIAAAADTTIQESLYLMKSINIVCTNNAVIVTSAWKPLNATSEYETTFSAIVGTRLSTSLMTDLGLRSSSNIVSPPSYQFDPLDFNGLISPNSVVSVAIQGSNLMIASLSTSTSTASPVVYFFSFATSVTNANQTHPSASLTLLCSLPGNNEIMTVGSSTGITTAMRDNLAVLGLSQLSEVSVYRLDHNLNTSSSTSCVWSSLGILRPSDSFPGDLFGYSVFISQRHILVGAPQALNALGNPTGGVYLYHLNTTSQQWSEEKIIKQNDQENFENNLLFQSTFGSKVYATTSAYFFADVPSSVTLFLGGQQGNLSQRDGQVYFLWTDFTSQSNQNNSNNNSIWDLPLMWILAVISVPIGLAFALFGYRFHESLREAKKTSLSHLSTQETAESEGSSSFTPSPFHFPSCVESQTPSESTNDDGVASILKLSPLVHHVFRPSLAPSSSSSSSKQSLSDLESNCSSPGQQTKSLWKFSDLVRGRNNYQPVAVPDSPSCRSESTTISLSSTPERGLSAVPQTHQEETETGMGQEGDLNWYGRLGLFLKFTSPTPSPPLPTRDAPQQDSLTRTSLQSPLPPPSHSRSHSRSSSNPMISSSVVE